MRQGCAIIGGFNALLLLKDKEGGKPVGSSNYLVFVEFARIMCNIDLDFVENKFMGNN